MRFNSYINLNSFISRARAVQLKLVKYFQRKRKDKQMKVGITLALLVSFFLKIKCFVEIANAQYQQGQSFVGNMFDYLKMPLSAS